MTSNEAKKFQAVGSDPLPDKTLNEEVLSDAKRRMLLRKLNSPLFDLSDIFKLEMNSDENQKLRSNLSHDGL